MQAGPASFRAARLDTVPVIEQAKGILMAQQGCDPEEAFDLLRRASQRFNVPVRVLAERLAHGVHRPVPRAPRVLDEALRDAHAAPTASARWPEKASARCSTGTGKGDLARAEELQRSLIAAAGLPAAGQAVWALRSWVLAWSVPELVRPQEDVAVTGRGRGQSSAWAVKDV